MCNYVNKVVEFAKVVQITFFRKKKYPICKTGYIKRK